MSESNAAPQGLISCLERMSEVSTYLWEKGWAERNAGNLSIDVTDRVAGENLLEDEPLVHFESTYPVLSGRYFLLTGSGRRFRDLAKEAFPNVCLLRVSDDGGSYRVVWGGGDEPGFRPTSEFPSHLRIHEFLRESGARQNVVLHTHPTELIALSHFPELKDEEIFNRVLWGIHPEVKVTVPQGVGFVPYAVPGTEALALASVEVFRRGRPVAVWEMHGCVAVGAEIMEAFDLIDTLNKAAKMVLICRAAGHMPEGLSKAQLDELVRSFDLDE